MMICGGTEATITPMGIGGFASMRALSTRNDEPQNASRPFDADRDGFVVGEGAGILILESLEHAQKRNAPILAEIVGYGMSGDAYHITQPAENGDGAFRVMKSGAERRQALAGRHRLRQRPRHLHAARRRHRNDGDEAPLWRARDQQEAARQLHQIHDRAPAWWRGRTGSGHQRPGPARPDSAAHHQPGNVPIRRAIWTTCRTWRAKPRSITRSRIPLALAEPTPP